MSFPFPFLHDFTVSHIRLYRGMSYLFRTTGQVVGVAGSGVILQAMLKHELRKRFHDEEVRVLIEHREVLMSFVVDLQGSTSTEYYQRSSQAATLGSHRLIYHITPLCFYFHGSICRGDDSGFASHGGHPPSGCHTQHTTNVPR